MFPILLRVLTIAGSCTIAALLTRKYLQRKAEEAVPKTQRPLSLEERNKSSAGDAESTKSSTQKVEGTKPAGVGSPTARGDANGADNRVKKEDVTGSDDAKPAPAAASVQSESKIDPKLESAKTSKTEPEPIADMDAARKKRDEAQQAAKLAKSQADERAERIAKSKEAAALAAQKAIEARRSRGFGSSGTFEAIKDPKDLAESPSSESPSSAAQSSEPQPSATLSSVPEPSGAVLEFSPEEKTVPAVEEKQSKDPAEDRARIVVQSSKQILDNYKHPQGAKVDLSLAQFSMQTAERLLSQSRFDEAFEKASAVGLLVGMAEMRAAIEGQLKSMKSEPDKAEQIKAVRAILNEGDRFLADASQSFISDDAGGVDYMSLLQNAFQKTMQAQNELLNSIA